MDLENGFADDPAECATKHSCAPRQPALSAVRSKTATGREEGPIYCFDHAVARIEAAVAAARSLPFPFTLTARAENFLHGNPDLADTIRRLQAFAEAGADVLYAPGLRSAEEVLAVVRAVAPKPVNVLMSGGLKLTVEQLSEMGVKRISVGSALALAALWRVLSRRRRDPDVGHVRVHVALHAVRRRPINCSKADDAVFAGGCSGAVDHRVAAGVGVWRGWISLPPQWNPWAPLDVKAAAELSDPLQTDASAR